MEQDIVNNLKSRVQKLEEELLRVVGIKLSESTLYCFTCRHFIAMLFFHTVYLLGMY